MERRESILGDRRERINWAWMAAAVGSLAITVSAFYWRYISCTIDTFDLCESIHNPVGNGPPFLFFILTAAIATFGLTYRAFYREERKGRENSESEGPMREPPSDYTLN